MQTNRGNKRSVIIALIALLLFTLVSTSCQHSQLSALKDMERMDAKDYFDSKLQVGFAEAIASGDEHSMQEFLNKGAGVNYIGRKGMTPLFWALCKQSPGGFKFLLENEANPNLETTNEAGNKSQELSIMQAIAIMKDPQYLKLAVEHGGEVNRVYGIAKQSIIFDAIMNRRIENVRTLISAKADKNLRDASGDTPMILAAEINQHDIVYLLLESGADPTIKDKWGYDLAALIKRYGDRGISPQSEQYHWYLKVVDDLKQKGLMN